MRRGWLLLALGLGAYLVFVVATLPASLVASRLADRGIESAASSGTVWEGRLTGVRSGQNYLGDVQWTLHPARLLAARAAAHIELTRPDGRAAAHVEVGLGGNVFVENATVDLPIDALAGVGAPAGWEGRLRADLESLRLADGWVTDAVGRIEARDVVGPQRRPVRMGGYSVVLPAGEVAATAADGTLVGALADLADGPLAVTGTIELAPDRTYRIEGLVAPRPSAPQGVVDSLRFLGRPDASGRRPFSIAGSL